MGRLRWLLLLFLWARPVAAADLLLETEKPIDVSQFASELQSAIPDLSSVSDEGGGKFLLRRRAEEPFSSVEQATISLIISAHDAGKRERERQEQAAARKAALPGLRTKLGLSQKEFEKLVDAVRAAE